VVVGVKLVIVDVCVAPLELLCAFGKDVSQHVSDLSLLLSHLLVNFLFWLILLRLLSLLVLDEKEG